MSSKINTAVIPFQHPFMLTACGPSQCGKTYWIFKLFKYIKEMIEPTPNKTIYLYDEMKRIIEAQKINFKFIECNKGIPKRIKEF